MTTTSYTRRDFVKIAGVAGGGLVLAMYLPGCGGREEAVAGDLFAPNAWLRIAADGRITVMVGRSEMGQGVTTSLPMLVAEELQVPLEGVGFEFAPADPAYRNPLLGSQSTGGSTSIRGHWETARQAGAAARTMLIAAAAQRWGVPAAECQAENGAVVHAGGDQRATYGELAEAAAAQPVPEEVTLAEPGERDLVGTRQRRLDTPLKVDGSAIFGIDVRRPDGLVAAVARPPVFGGAVGSYDDAAARAVPGVRDVVEIDAGIAVVADHYWAALQGKRALEIEWDHGPNADASSETISATLRQLAEGPGATAREDGDAAAALAGSQRTLQADYELPFLAHATMEPMNCTAHVRPDGCDVWVATQAQSSTKALAVELTGLAEDQVQVHTTFLGGGFGRRAEVDFVRDAVQTSQALGAPVKVVWSREDDTQHDFYRPASYHVLRAGLDADGRPSAWTHRLVVPSILARFAPGALEGGVDPEAVEGAVGLPYAIPNVHVDYHRPEIPVPVGWWRSVNHTHNAYVTECFLDELARAAGADPFEYRRGLLGGAPRHLGVLELAADRAGWGSSLPAGRARGIAVHEAFGSFVAEVAEVSLEDGEPRVHRVVAAVDCGETVNPAIIEAQLRSAIVYGLTAALWGEITIQDGRVVQGNFDDYRMLRIDEMPQIDVHIVPSSEAVGGIGEVGTPPITPAVVNALYALTGQPIRRMPIVRA